MLITLLMLTKTVFTKKAVLVFSLLDFRSHILKIIQLTYHAPLSRLKHKCTLHSYFNHWQPVGKKAHALV